MDGGRRIINQKLDNTSSFSTSDSDIRYSLDDEKTITPTVKKGEEDNFKLELKKLRKSVIKNYRIEEDSFGKLDEVFENYIKNKDTDNFLKELMEYSSYIKVKDFDDDTDILKAINNTKYSIEIHTKYEKYWKF